MGLSKKDPLHFNHSQKVREQKIRQATLECPVIVDMRAVIVVQVNFIGKLLFKIWFLHLFVVNSILRYAWTG